MDGANSSMQYIRLVNPISGDLCSAMDHLKQLANIVTGDEMMRLSQIKHQIEQSQVMLNHVIEGRDFDDPDTVIDVVACPYCGEKRYDWLVWDDFDLLNCQSCGTIYDPTDPK